MSGDQLAAPVTAGPAAVPITTRPILPFAIAILLGLLPACSGGKAGLNPGPTPDPGYQTGVREKMDEVLNEHNRLDGSPAYRFGEPVADRLARWYFEPEPEIPGHAYELAFVDGWCVEFWVTPRYVGYPQQLESHRMAFFADGRLRGLFSDGGKSAPMELDKWSPCWVDARWQPALLQTQKKN